MCKKEIRNGRPEVMSSIWLSAPESTTEHHRSAGDPEVTLELRFALQEQAGTGKDQSSMV